ncbi:MAG: O-antigen ligase family protein [Candidatus Gygaella obscura]|nr:O-antigen ligase family protein [Candidatus Gygaella obscura]
MNKSYLFKIMLAGIFAFMSAAIFLLAVHFSFMYSAYPMPSLLLHLAFFAILSIMVVIGKRESIVYIFMFTYPFFNITLSKVNILTIFTIILVFLYFKDISCYLKKGRDIFRVPMSIMGVAIVLTTIFSRYPLEALGHAIILFSLFGIYLVLNVFLINKERVRRFLIVLSVVALFSIIVVVWQLIFGIDSIKLFLGGYNENVGLGQIKRFPSFFLDAQEAGLFFLTMGIFLMGFTSKYFKNNLSLKAVVFLLFFALLLNVTRVAIFALISGVVLLAILRGKIIRLLIISMVGLFILLAGIPLFDHFPSSIKDRFSRYRIEESLEFRSTAWMGSFPIIKKYPFGTGLGRENTYYAAIKSKALFVESAPIHISVRGRAHFENTYLEVLYSLGVLGFLGFILIFLRFFYIKGIFIKKNLILRSRMPIAHIAVAMFSWAVCVFTSPRLNYVQTMLIFVIFLAFRNLYSVNRELNQ